MKWRSELEGDDGKEGGEKEIRREKKRKGKKRKGEKKMRKEKCFFTTPGFEPATFNSTGTAYRLKVESE